MIQYKNLLFQFFKRQLTPQNLKPETDGVYYLDLEKDGLDLISFAGNTGKETMDSAN